MHLGKAKALGESERSRIEVGVFDVTNGAPIARTGTFHRRGDGFDLTKIDCDGLLSARIGRGSDNVDARFGAGRAD